MGGGFARIPQALVYAMQQAEAGSISKQIDMLSSVEIERTPHGIRPQGSEPTIERRDNGVVTCKNEYI
jgi:hypothetical protein